MIGSIDEKLKVLTAEQEKENDQKWDTAVALESDGKGFIEVHETDEGYDYSIYSPDKKLMDGGVLEDTYQTAYQIAVSLCEENGFAQPSIVTDYDAFLEQVEAANEVKSSYRDVAVYYETANYAMKPVSWINAALPVTQTWLVRRQSRLRLAQIMLTIGFPRKLHCLMSLRGFPRRECNAFSQKPSSRKNTMDGSRRSSRNGQAQSPFPRMTEPALSWTR